jgi:DNA-binding transcriptional regulator GbsR (MarR family)
MYVPNNIIDAVKETKADTVKPKARKPYVKKLTSRILQAIGSGLRTSASIAKALGVDKAKIQSNLHHIKNRGLVHATKQKGKVELKYHLAMEKTVKKARKPYTKRVTKIVSLMDNSLVKNSQAHCQVLQNQLNEKSQRLSAIELTLIEKEKEVWTLECEVFDKKAIIKYLEEKLFQLGVRV